MNREDLDACVRRFSCKSDAHLSNCPEHHAARVVPDLLGQLQSAVDRARADRAAPDAGRPAEDGNPYHEGAVEPSLEGWALEGMGDHGAPCAGCRGLALLREIDRLRGSLAQARAEGAQAVLDDLEPLFEKVSAMRPEHYRTGQDHLPPAFREINFQAAFMALGEAYNEIEATARAAAQQATTDEDDQ